MSTAEVGAGTVGKLFGRQQALRLHDGTLAVHPLRLYRVQPRALTGQQTEHDPHAHALSGLDLSVMFTKPGAYGLADVPRGVIPNQQQRFLACCVQTLTTPRKKVNADGAYRPAINETEQHLIDDCV